LAVCARAAFGILARAASSSVEDGVDEDVGLAEVLAD
jgi:hypothetical protein